MSRLQQKVEAIEKVGAGDATDHTLPKPLHLHVPKYERLLRLLMVREGQSMPARLLALRTDPPLSGPMRRL
jgi:hypothetical protein